MHENTPETTLVCHARTPLVLDPVESRIERAQACENGDFVDTVVVRSWPDTVRLDDAGPHREVVEEFRRFSRWAENHGVTVEPPFETRTRASIVEDGGIEVLATPVLSLALYRNDRLAAVFPHTDGERTYTIADALDRLEAGELPRPIRGSSTEVPETKCCPDCGAELVNGQGVFVCPDCGWSGIPSADGWEVPAAEVEAPRQITDG